MPHFLGNLFFEKHVTFKWRNVYKWGQCTYNVTLRCVLELLLPWKSNKYYLLICVCVLAGILARGACACVYMHVALLIHHATPYCDVICSPPVSTTFFDIIS